MAAKQYFLNLEKGLKEALYEEIGNGLAASFFGKFEEKTKRKREELIYAISIPIALYLLFGGAAEFLCNFIGFAYPAQMSYYAVESPQKDDDTQWLTYWTVFGVFSVVDFWAKLVLDYVPFYWLLKCIFLLYLYLPFTLGAEYHYTHHLRPFFAKLGRLHGSPRVTPTFEFHPAPEPEPEPDADGA